MQTRRDPRFDSLSGLLDEQTFKDSYAFLETDRNDEISRLKIAVTATKRREGAIDVLEREAMAHELKRLESQQATERKRQMEKTGIIQWQQEEQLKRRAGKQPFFLKKGAEYLCCGSIKEVIMPSIQFLCCSRAKENTRRYAHSGSAEGQEKAEEGNGEEAYYRKAKEYCERSSQADALRLELHSKAWIPIQNSSHI